MAGEEAKEKGIGEYVSQRAKNDLLTDTRPDNILMQNAGLHPVINFSFMLRVEGIYDLPCKSIKSFHRENEFEYIQEGGLNDYVHLKRKPISKPFTFQVERYVGVDWLDPMPLGTEIILPVILFVNKYVFNHLKPVRTYAFTGCTVIGKDYGELNAESSGLLTEITTIAYREMLCIDVPSQALEEDSWGFEGKTKQGKGKRNYNQSVSNTTEKTRETLIEEQKLRLWKAERDQINVKNAKVSYEQKPKKDLIEAAEKNRWKIDRAGTKKGEGRQSARTHSDITAGAPIEKPKAMLEKNARRWPTVRSAVDIMDFLSRH